MSEQVDGTCEVCEVRPATEFFDVGPHNEMCAQCTLDAARERLSDAGKLALRLLPTGAAGEQAYVAAHRWMQHALNLRDIIKANDLGWKSDVAAEIARHDALALATPGRVPVAEVSKGDLLIPVAPTRDDDTVAQGILRHVAHMRRHDQLDQSLCWNPEELELLAMFAIDAKNKLKRVDEAEPTPEAGTVTEEMVEAASAAACHDWDGLDESQPERDEHHENHIEALDRYMNARVAHHLTAALAGRRGA